MFLRKLLYPALQAKGASDWTNVCCGLRYHEKQPRRLRGYAFYELRNVSPNDTNPQVFFSQTPVPPSYRPSSGKARLALLGTSPLKRTHVSRPKCHPLRYARPRCTATEADDGGCNWPDARVRPRPLLLPSPPTYRSAATPPRRVIATTELARPGQSRRGCVPAHSLLAVPAERAPSLGPAVERRASGRPLARGPT